METTFSTDDINTWNGHPLVRDSVRMPGHRGIWYALGMHYEYGDKYSGGLGTYTSNHQPMAVFVAAANKTFFTYGGTSSPQKRELTLMVSCFDHTTGSVSQPVVLYFDRSVDDPHDNAAIQVDPTGHVWVFKSGRGTLRPGLIFRSARPFDIDAFELVAVQEFTYPQVWLNDAGVFFLLFAKYKSTQGPGPARNLHWKTSRDGRIWSEDFSLAAFDGHYQTSGQCGNKIATFFNWHPGSDNDKRTNLYYAQTTDLGKSWTTADGTPLKLPLDKPDNAALVMNYQSLGKCMYTCDVNFDSHGNPVLLFIISRKGEPGPAGGAREWTLLRWKNGKWTESVVAVSDHNYDMGSLYIQDDVWKIIGPTEAAPQPHGTGGEMALWTSTDAGESWRLEKQLTSGSRCNHSYARRPENAADPFWAFWADGDPTQLTESHLYFCDSEGDHVRALPYAMKNPTEPPRDIS